MVRSRFASLVPISPQWSGQELADWVGALDWTIDSACDTFGRKSEVKTVKSLLGYDLHKHGEGTGRLGQYASPQSYSLFIAVSNPVRLAIEGVTPEWDEKIPEGIAPLFEPSGSMKKSEELPYASGNVSESYIVTRVYEAKQQLTHCSETCVSYTRINRSELGMVKCGMDAGPIEATGNLRKATGCVL